MKNLIRLVSFLVCLGLLFSPLSGVVRSAPLAPTAPALTVTPGKAAQGTQVQVKGTGFNSSDVSVSLYLDVASTQNPIIGLTNTILPDGSWLMDVMVPPWATVASHKLIAVGTNRGGNEQAETTLSVTASGKKAAFITGSTTRADASFKTLLDANGITTDLIPYDQIGSSQSFASYDMVFIGPDSYKSSPDWGTANALTALAKFSKPIFGIGDGGYYYFGTGGNNQANYLGFGNGAHGSGTGIDPTAPTSEPFRQPAVIPNYVPYTIFNTSVATVEIYYPQKVGQVFTFGAVPQSASYYLLLQQGRFFEWGFDGPASAMTTDGSRLFVNFAWYMLHILSRDTLVVSNLQRMRNLGYSAADVDDLQLHLTDLVGRPASTSNMNAIRVDLSVDAPASVQTVLTSWASNLSDVDWTNTAVNNIDGYLENLKRAAYPNLKYFILVGSHETIPMAARAADNYDETSWNIPSGYLATLYHSTAHSAKGYYLTDTVYRDLSYVNDGWGVDSKLVPEMAVGRMVETPAQISASIDTYLASKASLSRTNLAAIGSQDYMDGATSAATAMGPTADTTLIQNGFLSTLVPPKLNAKHSIVYIGGHGDYNWMTTREWDQGFEAGASGSQGDTEDLSNLNNAAIAAAGCHNGVVFPDKTYHDYNGTITYGDFPERLANKQVGVYAAATGYTWVSISGSSTNVANTMYSEKATALFIKHLMKDGSTTAGKAFNAALNEYVNDRGVGMLDTADRRVLSIFTLYGIPNYRFATFYYPIGIKFGYYLKILPLLLAGPQPASPLLQVSQQVTLDVNNYTVESSGLVTIPGASYAGDSDHPVLPVITAKLNLPQAPTGLTINWDSASSTFVEITNDVPPAHAGVIPTPGGTLYLQPNNMTFTGYYPANLLYSTMTSPAGGGGVDLNLGVTPVQYDKDTHKTKIWTHLVFNVSYNSDLSLSSLDSDGDGLPDWWEVANGLDPFNATGINGATGDPDQDKLSNAQEYAHGTDPMNPDTDYDGYLDGIEVQMGYDPLNPGSHPNFSFLPSVRR
jgi:hypothetical protein